MIDGGKPARRELLQGFDTPTEGEVLSLVPAGKSAGGIYGWDFKWGTTGLCPLGGGYFYISQNARSKETKQQSSTVRLYRWTGDADAPSGRSNSPSPVVPCPGRSCERPGVFLSVKRSGGHLCGMRLHAVRLRVICRFSGCKWYVRKFSPGRFRMFF